MIFNLSCLLLVLAITVSSGADIMLALRDD